MCAHFSFPRLTPKAADKGWVDSSGRRRETTAVWLAGGGSAKEQPASPPIGWLTACRDIDSSLSAKPRKEEVMKSNRSAVSGRKTEEDVRPPAAFVAGSDG